MENKTQEPNGQPAPAYLTIDRIRAAGDLATLDVEVPQWGGKVKVKPLTIGQMHSSRKQAELPRENPDGTFRTDYDAEELELAVFVQGVVEPRFTNADKDWLREEVSYGAVSRITKVILEASGMGAGAEKKPRGSSEPTRS